MTETTTLLPVTEALRQPFPPNALKTRNQSGKNLTYVEGHTVIHRLNDATGNQWDFAIKDIHTSVAGKDRDGNDILLVRAHVAMTIPGLGTREHIGVQSVRANAGEDLVKGAVTDALKKAATLFGVGLELYGPDYEAGETQQMHRVQSMSQREPQRDSGPPPPLPPDDFGAPVDFDRPGPSSNFGATDRQRGLIQALAREQKISGPALDELAKERTGAPFSDLTRQNASNLIEFLRDRQPAARA